MKDLPIYDITIEDDKEIQGVSKISLVDVPAIGVNWIALKKQPKMLLATPECFGCPPNGDGTRIDGEPDGRCRIGDGPSVAGGTTGPKGSTIPRAVAPVNVDYGKLNEEFTSGNQETDIVNRYFLKPPGEEKTGENTVKTVFRDGMGSEEDFEIVIATNPDGTLMEYRDPDRELEWSGEDAKPWNDVFEKSLTESQSAPMPDFYEAISWDAAMVDPFELDPNNPEDAADYALFEEIKQNTNTDDVDRRYEIFQETKFEEQRALYNTSLDTWEDNLRAQGLTYEEPGSFILTDTGGGIINYDVDFGGDMTGFSPNPDENFFPVSSSGRGENDTLGTETMTNMISNREPNIQVLNVVGDIVVMPQSVAQRIYIGHDTEFSAKTPTGRIVEYTSGSTDPSHGLSNLGNVVGFRQIQDENGNLKLQVAYKGVRTVYTPGARNSSSSETIIYRDVYGSEHRRQYLDYEKYDPFNAKLQPTWSKVPTDAASFLSFKKMFFNAVPDKKMLYGPFLIPNKLIYRRDDKNGEYYVRFSADEIKKIAEKFNEQLKNKEINFMHTDQNVEAFVSENWITDGVDDKSKTFGFDLPQGTWFGGVKIKNDKFWTDEVKSEKVRGFSVEILGNLELKMIKKIKKESMKKTQKVKLGSTLLGDGKTAIYFDGETIEVGTKIFTDEVMTMPAKDDRWVLEDGRIIVVINGEVSAIEDQTLMAEEPTGETETVDKMAGCIKNQMARYGDEQKAKMACEKMMGGKKEEKMEAPVGAPVAQTLTAEEVSLMIDSRYQELMDEITALKSMMGEKEEEYEEYKKQVSEKFKMTPSEPSIKKDVQKVKFNDKFTEMEARVKAFAKVK